jgi:ABC-2 type transport system ATP-binding protein
MALLGWGSPASAGTGGPRTSRTMTATPTIPLSAVPDVHAEPEELGAARIAPTIDVLDVRRAFGARTALDGVSLGVDDGQIHALLGPNGAGKTTLLRILSGLLAADSGSVRLLGNDVTANPKRLRGRVGLVPAGDRTFYLRLNGLENLAFFARLQGMKRKEAYPASIAALADVGLADAAFKRVGEYSHGMQKRLSVARALLARPAVLLVDEATHDLDPEGAVRVRALVRVAADRGAAVIWATQRLDEIRSFAQTVTLLDKGCVRFGGSVGELTQVAEPRHYVLQVGAVPARSRALESRANIALGTVGTVEPIPDEASATYRLTLATDAGVGQAIAQLEVAGIRVLTCRQERSEIEEAFLALTTSESG